MRPRSGGVRALQPQPTNTKRDPLAVKVWDAEATQLKVAADTLPMEGTVATVGLLLAVLEEPVNSTVYLLEHWREKSNDHHDVERDCA